jgi:hypothetical protein
MSSDPPSRAQPDPAAAPDDLVFTVSRSEIRRFALAVGASADIHHDVTAARRAGYRDLVAPPCFFTALGSAAGRMTSPEQLRADGLPPDDSLESQVVVAGGSDFEFASEICAGDTVWLTVREAPPEHKHGSTHDLTIFRTTRTYSVELQTVAVETYTRIGKKSR